MPSSLVWFNGYLKWWLAHLSWSLHPPSGVIIQPYLHLHELSLLLPSFSFNCSCLSLLLLNFCSAVSILMCFGSVLWLPCCSIFFISSLYVRFNSFLFHFVRCFCFPFHFNRFNLTIIGTSIWVCVLVLVLVSSCS